MNPTAQTTLIYQFEVTTIMLLVFFDCPRTIPECFRPTIPPNNKAVSPDLSIHEYCRKIACCQIKYLTPDYVEPGTEYEAALRMVDRTPYGRFAFSQSALRELVDMVTQEARDKKLSLSSGDISDHTC